MFASALRADDVAERVTAGGVISFAEFLVSPDYAGPFAAPLRSPTSPEGVSPIVLAVAEASEGRAPTRIDEATSQRVFRCSRTALGTGVIPQTIVLSAGRGGGKTSALLAPKAVHAAFTVPCPFARPGQELASVLVAPTLSQAQEGFRYVKGLIEASPVLSRCVVKNSDALGMQYISIRRPDDLVVRIEVKAANAQGSAARAPTLVFFGMDEGAFFADASGAKNDQAQYEAAMGSFRGSKAAQVWIVSSPWVEGEGLMEEKNEEGWGTPGRALLVAARVSTYDLKGIEDDSSERPRFGRDEDAYKREILAIPLPAGSTSFFDGQAIMRAMARRFDGVVVATGAGGDIALENDLSASVVVQQIVGGAAGRDFADPAQGKLYNVPADGLAAADARTEELKGSEVAAKLALPVQAHGLKRMLVDGHSFAAMSEHFDNLKLKIFKCDTSHEFKMLSWGYLRDALQEDRIAFGDLPPETRDWLMMQLRQVAAKRMAGGKVELSIPRLSARQEQLAAARGQARRGHADAIAALVLAIADVHAAVGRPAAGTGSAKILRGAPTRWSRGMLGG